MRIGLQPRTRLSNPDSLQQLNRPIIRERAFHSGRLFNRLDQLRADGQKGVQRGLRVLKDHPDPVAAHLAHFVLSAPAQLLPFKED